LTNGITPGCYKIDGIATNGNMDESASMDLTTETRGIASSSIEIKSNGWQNTLWKDNFKKVETRNSASDANAYCDMFAISKFWFASRTICVSRYSTGNIVNWNLFKGSGGNATGASGITIYSIGNSLSTSSGGAFGGSYSYAACPIVNIPITQINMSSDYNATTGWNLN